MLNKNILTRNYYSLSRLNILIYIQIIRVNALEFGISLRRLAPRPMEYSCPEIFQEMSRKRKQRERNRGEF